MLNTAPQILRAALAIVLTIGSSSLSAQSPSKRIVRVIVTDPLGRFVTGLEQKNFEIVENGVQRTITDFSNSPAPIAMAVVSEAPLSPENTFNGPQDELIQTQSPSDALRRLAASKNSRKVLVLTTAGDTQAIPAGIEVLQIEPGNLLKTMRELHNQYTLQFESVMPTSSIEVVLNPPRGLPPLRASLN